ncbi:DegT/DnrJ/EryC1/StrS family aminotransferase [Shimia ponticola]|uniref:DegT/DnrJ/EryC1/StrS family aminotransferase n=1 Tax=Shimia ponticola TaxID=2582893 RepID=UPI0011BEA999|nr:aminotransferase class I/II-fold pyridoxal phosphate-dependent enzyme [Shimia ponticola]
MTTTLPDVHQAEPIPQAAWEEVQALLTSADLFRYTAPENSPVARLETAFAEKLGAKYAVAVASCSAALFLSLKALGLPRGAKVLIPAFTFAAVPSSVVHADCEPVLIDVKDNYRIDIEDYLRKLPDADAVMISHMRGHTSDMDAIMQAADAAGIPVIEDAAHSLGTLWNGRKIGTIGKIGCFSFQSYKMLNAGEGGILISEDADLIARAVIMSGAYEHNWKKHPVLHDAFAKWQNELPLYNTRMSNLSAAVILPQLDELERRCVDGLRNHDHMADLLNATPYFNVPPALPQETRAPDSIQFNLVGFTDDQARGFVQELKDRHLGAQVFGLSTDNARAFWNWRFIGPQGPLPQTEAMLVRACDVRLPVRLSLTEVEAIAEAVIAAAETAKMAKAA